MENMTTDKMMMIRELSVAASDTAIKLESVQDFLSMKYTDGEISEDYRRWQRIDEDRWYDCELQYVDEGGNLLTAYIHDATYDIEETADGERHTLVVYISLSGELPIKIRKRCIAPIGCDVDWDKVVCAFEVV